MRSMLMIAAAVAAGLAVPPGLAVAQSDGRTIEESPLAPLRPRLPGGTVVTPEMRIPLPGAVIPPGAPEGEGPRTGAEAGGTPPGETGEPGTAAMPDAEGVPGAVAVPGTTTQPGGEAQPGEGGEAAAGAATAALPEGDAPPLTDLFKRAPPGTGGERPQSPQLIDPIARSDAPGAVLRQLDKLTGRIDTFELAAGAETTVARLRVALTECRLPADGTTGDHIAFLRVWDTKEPDAGPVFSGWMFADSPALSAMDHPRYDLWVIRCMTAEGSASEANR